MCLLEMSHPKFKIGKPAGGGFTEMGFIAYPGNEVAAL
jgi:hypothetical protein